MKDEQKSKELQAIEDAINTYIEKHNEDCVINVSISGFDSNHDVIDDLIWLHGDSELLLISNESMKEDIQILTTYSN
jgi:hypothetical protein